MLPAPRNGKSAIAVLAVVLPSVPAGPPARGYNARGGSRSEAAMPLVTYTWMAVVAALVCAAIGWLGIAGWLAAVVVAASVAAHVAGNALGTRLRDATDRHLRARRRRGDAPPPLPAAAPAFLETRTSLGRLVPVSVAIGAVCGGTARVR